MFQAILGYIKIHVSKAPLCQGSEYTRVLNMPLVLNLPEFWIYQSSEYVRVTQGSEYAWLCLIMPGWISLDMSEYAGICLNMLKSACMIFVLFSPLLSLVYLKVWLLISTITQNQKLYCYEKLRLLFQRHKILFFLYSSCKYFIWFLF